MCSEKIAVRGWNDDKPFCAVARHLVKSAPLVLGDEDLVPYKLLVIEEGIRKKFLHVVLVSMSVLGKLKERHALRKNTGQFTSRNEKEWKEPTVLE